MRDIFVVCCFLFAVWGGRVLSTSLSNCRRNVTLHYEMSRNKPDGHFDVFIFSKFYAIFNGQNHFQIRGLVAELDLHAFEYGGYNIRHF